MAESFVKPSFEKYQVKGPHMRWRCSDGDGEMFFKAG
jgi:hypothetical protein